MPVSALTILCNYKNKEWAPGYFGVVDIAILGVP